jgi:molecular chaperone IbpA
MTQHKFIPSVFGDHFKEFDKFFVGFDGGLQQIQKLHDDLTKNIPNYPPHNIKKTGDNTYVIEMAVAGFGKQDIEIEIDGGKLTVKGNVRSSTDEKNDYIFQGIAARNFVRTFGLNDQVVVKDAELFNGMLKIALERLIPESKKPVKVPVKTGSEKQLLSEGSDYDKAAERL